MIEMDTSRTDLVTGSGFRTDRGPYADSQDNVLTGANFIVIADGVSSVPGSGSAAAMAVDTYASIARHLPPSNDLTDILWQAPAIVAERLATAQSRGVTTVAAAVLDDAGRIWITHVGDSTITILTSGGVQLNTRPHHQAEYARMTGDTDPNAIKATHRVMRSLGADRAYIEPEIAIYPVKKPIVVIAATDGITEKVPLRYMSWLLSEKPLPVSTPTAVGHTLQSWANDYAEQILNHARTVGLEDNATVAVLAALPKEQPH